MTLGDFDTVDETVDDTIATLERYGQRFGVATARSAYPARMWTLCDRGRLDEAHALAADFTASVGGSGLIPAANVARLGYLTGDRELVARAAQALGDDPPTMCADRHSRSRTTPPSSRTARPRPFSRASLVRDVAEHPGDDELRVCCRSSSPGYAPGCATRSMPTLRSSSPTSNAPAIHPRPPPIVITSRRSGPRRRPR